MFKLPSVRGFPRTSNTAQICGHIEDAKRKSRHRHPTDILPDRREINLSLLFAPPPTKPPPPPRELNRAPDCTAYITTSEKKLLIETGQRYVKKDGTLGAKQKIPFMLVTVEAHILHGKHRAFFYRVTNKATKVFDSRTEKRLPIEDVRAELERLCQPAMAQATADSLAEMLQPPRERKPRERKTSITTTSPPFSLTVKRVPFSARKWLLSDKWLYA